MQSPDRRRDRLLPNFRNRSPRKGSRPSPADCPKRHRREPITAGGAIPTRAPHPILRQPRRHLSFPRAQTGRLGFPSHRQQDARHDESCGSPPQVRRSRRCGAVQPETRPGNGQKQEDRQSSPPLQAGPRAIDKSTRAKDTLRLVHPSPKEPGLEVAGAGQALAASGAPFRLAQHSVLRSANERIVPGQDERFDCPSLQVARLPLASLHIAETGLRSAV